MTPNLNHAQATEYEDEDGIIILSTLASYGSWWHTVLYRHIWQESGGPNSKIIHLYTEADDNSSRQQLVDKGHAAILLIRSELPQ